MSEAFVALVAIMTVVAVLTRPRGIDEGVWALAGGLVLVISGRLSLADVEHVLRELTGVITFLVGLFWITLTARRAGIFDRVAHYLLRASRGSGSHFMIAVFVFGALTTAVLSNDATVVLVTPVILAACQRVGLPPLPYLFACSFVADTASSLLPVSNPINLLYAERFDLSFGRHILLLGLPTIVAIAVNAVVILWLFRRQLRSPFNDSDRDQTLAPLTTTDRWIVVGILGVGLGYVAAAFVGVLPWLVTFAGGIGLGAIGLAGRRLTPLELVRVQPPSLFAFVVGLALVVRAADVAGLLGFLGSAVERASEIGGFSGLLAVTLGTALGTNLVNNWTMVLAISGPLERSDASDDIIAGSMLGADIGPNLSVVGSLATLIWLTEVRRGGLAVSSGTYLRIGIVTTIPTILAATIALHIVGQFT